MQEHIYKMINKRAGAADLIIQNKRNRQHRPVVKSGAVEKMKHIRAEGPENIIDVGEKRLIAQNQNIIIQIRETEK